MAEPKPTTTYRDAGVDMEAGDELVERIKPAVRRSMRPEVLGDEPIIDAKLCAGAAHEDQRRVLPRVSSDAVGVVVGDPEQILVRLIEPLHRHGVGVAELDLCGVELKFKMDQPQGELRCPCGQQQTQQGSQ